MGANPYTPCPAYTVYSKVDVYTLFQNMIATLGNSTYYGTGLPTTPTNLQLVDSDIYKWYIDLASLVIYNYHNGGWFAAGGLAGSTYRQTFTQVPQVLSFNTGTSTLSLSNGGGAATIVIPQVLNKVVAQVGNGITSTITVTDNLPIDKQATLRNSVTNVQYTNVVITYGIGTTQFVFPTVPGQNAYKAIIIG